MYVVMKLGLIRWYNKETQGRTVRVEKQRVSLSTGRCHLESPFRKHHLTEDLSLLRLKLPPQHVHACTRVQYMPASMRARTYTP